jgi:hypothetical protein
VTYGIQEIATLVRQNDMFNAPFLATSPRDLWGKRWNISISYTLRRIIFRFHGGHTLLFGMLTFLGSGILVNLIARKGFFHEYLNYSAFRILSGEHMMFFLISGIVCAAQFSLQPKIESLWIVKMLEEKNPFVLWVIQVVLTSVLTTLMSPLFIAPYARSAFLRGVKFGKPNFVVLYFNRIDFWG